MMSSVTSIASKAHGVQVSELFTDEFSTINSVGPQHCSSSIKLHSLLLVNLLLPTFLIGFSSILCLFLSIDIKLS